MAKGKVTLTDNLVLLIGLAFLLLAVAAPISPDLSDHMMFKASVLEIYIAALAVFFLLRLKTGELTYVIQPIPMLLLVLIIWGAISLLWSERVDFGLVLLFKWLTGLTLAMLVFQVRKFDDVLRLMQFLFAAALVISVLGICQYLFGLDFIPQTKPPAATFANRNMAGQVLVLSWLPGLYFLLVSSKKDTPSQFYYAIGLVLVLTYAIYTGSRAVSLSIFVQLVLIGIYAVICHQRGVRLIRRENLGPKALGVALVLFLILINMDGTGFKPAWNMLGERFANIEEEISREEGPNAFKRFLLWDATARMIRDEPWLGRGMGGFEATHQQYAFGDTVYASQAHNDYLQTTAELGLVAPLTIFALGILFFLKVWGLWRQPDRAEGFARYIILALLAGIAVDAFFSFPLQLIGPIMLGAALLGMFFRLEHLAVDTERKLRLQQAPWAALTMGYLAFMLLLVVFNKQWYDRLGDLSEVVRAERTRQPLVLDMWVEHPVFRRTIWLLTNDYRVTKPRKAEKIAAAYAAVNNKDVIVMNTLAITTVLQKRYDEARGYIQQARALEVAGNYSSWVTELVMLGQLQDKKGLASVLAKMRREPREALLAQQYTQVAMALGYWQLDEPETALELLRDTAQVHPYYAPTFERMVQMLIRLNRKDEAVAYLEKLAAISGETPSVQSLRRLLTKKEKEK